MDDKILGDAAREGNTFKLQELLENDPLLLERVMPLSTETPLHVSVLAGKLEFVEQLLRRAPWLAAQSNRHGLNALHMAAAKGHVHVVTLLLEFNHELVLMFDAQGFGPLHYAAYYGRSEVVRVLVSSNFSLLKQVNFVGETALHVAVKSNQHEVLRVMEEMLRDVRNDEFCKQVMMHLKDKYGHSVANLLVASSYKGNNLFQVYVSEVRESGDEVVDNNNTPNQLNVGDNESETKLVNKEDFLRQVVLVIMGLLTTVTFQSLISPPQSLWKVSKQQNRLLIFLVYNTAAFLTSCWGLIAVFLRDDIFMIIFWLASSVTCLIFSYIYVLLPMIPGNDNYLFLRKLLILFSVNMFLSVVLCSRTFSKVLAKTKEYWQRSANGLTLTATTNRSNPNNPMLALSSGTSRINTAPV